MHRPFRAKTIRLHYLCGGYFPCTWATISNQFRPRLGSEGIRSGRQYGIRVRFFTGDLLMPVQLSWSITLNKHAQLRWTSQDLQPISTQSFVRQTARIWASPGSRIAKTISKCETFLSELVRLLPRHFLWMLTVSRFWQIHAFFYLLMT